MLPNSIAGIGTQKAAVKRLGGVVGSGGSIAVVAALQASFRRAPPIRGAVLQDQ